MGHSLSRVFIANHHKLLLFRLLRRYKAAGANAVDETGALDTVEFINVSKDDALAWPNKVHRDYPSTVNARMGNTIKPFIQKSVEVNSTLIEVFNDKLGLPKGALMERHKMFEPSCSESRCIRNPPRPGGDDSKAALGAHTDFGSLVRRHHGTEATPLIQLDRQSFLHNRLGGLQVMPPGSQTWQYIKVRSDIT